MLGDAVGASDAFGDGRGVARALASACTGCAVIDSAVVVWMGCGEIVSGAWVGIGRGVARGGVVAKACVASADAANDDAAGFETVTVAAGATAGRGTTAPPPEHPAMIAIAPQAASLRDVCIGVW